MGEFGWAVTATVLIVILGAANPKIGGWFLLMIVIGMVYAAHSRTDANGQTYL